MLFGPGQSGFAGSRPNIIMGGRVSAIQQHRAAAISIGRDHIAVCSHIDSGRFDRLTTGFMRTNIPGIMNARYFCSKIRRVYWTPNPCGEIML